MSDNSDVSLSGVRLRVGVRHDGKYTELRNDVVTAPPDWSEKELSVSVATEAIQAVLNGQPVPKWTLAEGHALDSVEIRLDFEATSESSHRGRSGG